MIAQILNLYTSEVPYACYLNFKCISKHSKAQQCLLNEALE